eukprot:TRINITY_DN57167_c0_g1_i1.p1 TRINITY_DN57167_c0_g1~~TRINITY_DN57167_c0_g1_i1.p1  ORF type:complete len:302 (+),score=68.37 TRINITY_DN57167_c0_g1_i1:51-956(+)
MPAAPLHAELQAALEDIRSKRAFNAADWIEKKCKMFNEWMKNAGLKGCVVNVSGGIDSAVTLGLCMKASKMEGSTIEKVLGICQPIKSTESVWKRGLDAIEKFGAISTTIDGTGTFEAMSKQIEDEMKAKGVPISDKQGFARGQLKSYLRTPVAFFAAQSLNASGIPSVVVGTGNKDEDGYLCYFCKAGDGVCDVQLINDLHKKEVFTVAKELGAPESIIVAPPTADLWEGQTDEDELGFSYDFVELWTTYLAYDEAKQAELKAKLGDEAKAQFETLGAAAAKVHNANKHKLNFPVNLNLL